jgi:hypothetical protein
VISPLSTVIHLVDEGVEGILDISQCQPSK